MGQTRARPFVQNPPPPSPPREFFPPVLHPLGRDLEVAPPRRGARLWKTLAFSLVFRFPDASRAGRPRPDCPSAFLPLSMSANRFSWVSMLAFLPHSSRPFVSFLSFCVKASSKRSASPHLRVSSSLPLSSRSLCGLGGLCVRHSSALHPLPIRPGAARCRTPGSGVHGWREITENIGVFACFPVVWILADGRPRPDCSSALLPPYAGDYSRTAAAMRATRRFVQSTASATVGRTGPLSRTVVRAAP